MNEECLWSERSALRSMSQVKIQCTEKVIEKYTEKNQLVKCVYSISLRIQLSLLASHAARDIFRKRRCPSRKTSLLTREGCIHICPVILIHSWVILEVVLHFAEFKTVWYSFSLQQRAIKSPGLCLTTNLVLLLHCST